MVEDTLVEHNSIKSPELLDDASIVWPEEFREKPPINFSQLEPNVRFVMYNGADVRGKDTFLKGKIVSHIDEGMPNNCIHLGSGTHQVEVLFHGQQYPVNLYLAPDRVVDNAGDVHTLRFPIDFEPEGFSNLTTQNADSRTLGVHIYDVPPERMYNSNMKFLN